MVRKQTDLRYALWRTNAQHGAFIVMLTHYDPIDGCGGEKDSFGFAIQALKRSQKIFEGQSFRKIYPPVDWAQVPRPRGFALVIRHPVLPET
jgi:hypothetical protein